MNVCGVEYEGNPIRENQDVSQLVVASGSGGLCLAMARRCPPSTPMERYPGPRLAFVSLPGLVMSMNGSMIRSWAGHDQHGAKRDPVVVDGGRPSSSEGDPCGPFAIEGTVAVYTPLHVWCSIDP